MSPSHGAEAAQQEDVQSERSGLQPPLGPAGAAGAHQAWVRWGGDAEGLFPPLSTCSERQTCPAPEQRLPALLVLFQKNRSPLPRAHALRPQCSLQTQGLHRCHPDRVRHRPAGFRPGRSRLCLRARLRPSFSFAPRRVVRLVGSRRQLYRAHWGGREGGAPLGEEGVPSPAPAPRGPRRASSQVSECSVFPLLPCAPLAALVRPRRDATLGHVY